MKTIVAFLLSFLLLGGCDQRSSPVEASKDIASSVEASKDLAAPSLSEAGGGPTAAWMKRRMYGEVRARLLQTGYRPTARSDICGYSAQCIAFPEAQACSQGIQNCTFAFDKDGQRLTITTRGENEEKPGEIVVVAVDEGPAPAPETAALPLTAMSEADLDDYAGAGCVATYKGAVIFVTDMQEAAVRNRGALAPLTRIGDDSFDPDSIQSWEGEGFTLSFERRPGPVSLDPENESSKRPVRLTMTERQKHIGVDAMLECGS